MSPRAWAAFWAMSLIWGLPYFFIKVAVDELSPAFVAWSRVVLAVAVVLPLAWGLGALHGLRRPTEEACGRRMPRARGLQPVTRVSVCWSTTSASGAASLVVPAALDLVAAGCHVAPATLPTS
jgi:drug/metabolite transporter (DMT)-like permease